MVSDSNFAKSNARCALKIPQRNWCLTPLVTVSVLVLLSSCAAPKPSGAQIDPALSILIPPDTVLAVAVHADKLRMTPVYQKYLADRGFPELDRMAHLTGMDPRKDLWQLLF